MNKSFLRRVKLKLIKRNQTIADLYRELNYDGAYNTFYQVIAGQRDNRELIDKVKEHLGLK